ncbi:MAG TPA: hypothetical protein VNO55_22125 [Polyangia bacterium]|nr:hypothetical protein [Polyangia bacterium]
MNDDEAEEALAEADLVPCLQAPLTEIKEIRETCLAADIPVLLQRDACCGKGGCGCAPKLVLLSRPVDAPRIAQLLTTRWREMALREGTVDPGHPALAVPADGEPPCPACGATAGLVSGACAECGLQLE